MIFLGALFATLYNLLVQWQGTASRFEMGIVDGNLAFIYYSYSSRWGQRLLPISGEWHELQAGGSFIFHFEPAKVVIGILMAAVICSAGGWILFCL